MMLAQGRGGPRPSDVNSPPRGEETLPPPSDRSDPGQSATGWEVHDLADRDAGGRVAVPRSVWLTAFARADFPGLTPLRASILQALASLLASTGAPDGPITRQQIADTCAFTPSVKSVDRATAAAEAAGWLHVIHRRGGSNLDVATRGNVYRLTLPHEHPWAAEWRTDPQPDRLERARTRRGYQHTRRSRRADRTQCDSPGGGQDAPAQRGGDPEGPQHAPAHASRPPAGSQPPAEGEKAAGETNTRQARPAATSRAHQPGTSQAPPTAPHTPPGRSAGRSEPPTAGRPRELDAQNRSEPADSRQGPAGPDFQQAQQLLEAITAPLPAADRTVCRNSTRLVARCAEAAAAGWTPTAARQVVIDAADQRGMPWPRGGADHSPVGLLARRLGWLDDHNPPTSTTGTADTDSPPEEPCQRCHGHDLIQLPDRSWQQCPDCTESPHNSWTLQLNQRPDQVGELAAHILDP